jgi:hypothetical protein
MDPTMYLQISPNTRGQVLAILQHFRAPLLPITESFVAVVTYYRHLRWYDDDAPQCATGD